MTNNLIALSLIFVMLRLIHIKKMSYLTVLALFLLAFDVFWYITATPIQRNSISTISSIVSLPIKFILPKMYPDMISKCVNIGIGEIALPGLFYKMLKTFDLQFSSFGEMGRSALIGYTLGMLISVLVMVLF